MKSQEEFVDPITGEILPMHPTRRAPVARRFRRHRTDEDGAEVLDPTPLVSALLRPPSIKDRIKTMIRSGELAQQIRMAQNAMNSDDDDFEGYDRNFADEHFVSPYEADAASREFGDESPKAPPASPQAPKEPSATPVPEPTSTQTEGPPTSNGGPSQVVS